MNAARTLRLPRSARPGDIALITGGAGFIATNVADRLLAAGWRVRLFDNLSRAGVEQNVRWLPRGTVHVSKHASPTCATARP
jgi:NAD(P)-dependent dehydrogenase (short-subunit alcohol dehydrogenase family)